MTGFLFPFHKFLPSQATGIVSLLVLAVTIPALYFFHLVGPWRRTYGIGAVVRFYLNVFCFDRQAFAKIPALKSLAPTQSEPVFLGVLPVKRFRAEAIQVA